MRYLRIDEIAPYVNSGKTLELLGEWGGKLEQWETIKIYNIWKEEDQYIVGLAHVFMPDEITAQVDYVYMEPVDPDVLIENVTEVATIAELQQFIKTLPDVDADRFTIFPMMNEVIRDKLSESKPG